MITLSITIEEPLLKKLDRSVKEAALGGRSEAVREAIRAWLDRQELQKKIQREIAGYRKKPVKKDEFESLMSLQEIPE